MVYSHAASKVTVNLGTERVSGGDGNDILSEIENIRGSLYGDSITGDEANNTFYGDAGNDTLDGGEGTDVAMFGGDYEDYLISYDSVNDSWTVTDTGETGDGADTVTGVEQFAFADLTKSAEAWDAGAHVTYWKSGADLAGVTGSLTDNDSDRPTGGTSDAEGEISYGMLIGGDYGMGAVKAVTTNDARAIQASDALAALKIAFGMNPNGTGGAAVSSYQYLAADVNQNGRVEAADALNILKMAFNMPSAPQKEWEIVPESVGSETMTRSAVDWSKAEIPEVTLDQDLEMPLVGVLMGDVNGSWTAGAA